MIKPRLALEFKVIYKIYNNMINCPDLWNALNFKVPNRMSRQRNKFVTEYY